MKYKIIHKSNSPNPHKWEIDEALLNHQRPNPVETKYSASNYAWATPLMDMLMMQSMENDDGTLFWL